MLETSQIVAPSTPDVQSGRPATAVSLTRVGIRGVEKVISVADGHGLYFAELECFVDLDRSARRASTCRASRRS